MGSCLTTESPASPMESLGAKKKKNSRKKWSRSLSLDNKREEMLLKIPGRMFLNCSSELASMFTQQGKKGTNQDAMIVWENFCSRPDTIFCGVFDGHGPFGDLVSKRVRDSLPLKLISNWEKNRIFDDDDDVLKEIDLNQGGSPNSCEDTSFFSAEEESRLSSLDAEETEKQPEIFQTLKASFLKTFKLMDRELKMHTNINCICSGTTAVTVVKQGQDLVIGNLGDSRAILATKDENDSLIAVQLTVDLKPSLPGEAERIRKCKGRVYALSQEPGVARVWLPNSDAPGLAMARALGDFCLKGFGVISVPVISFRRLTEKDAFLVLASDGIWDVLSNQEVVDIVASSPKRSQAAQRLVESAVGTWRYKYPTSKVDDCAAVCLFLDSTATSSLSTASAAGAESREQQTEGHSGNEQDAMEGNEEEGSEVNDEWSAREGVARIDTLLSLPRFVPTPGAESKKRK